MEAKSEISEPSELKSEVKPVQEPVQKENKTSSKSCCSQFFRKIKLSLLFFALILLVFFSIIVIQSTKYNSVNKTPPIVQSSPTPSIETSNSDLIGANWKTYTDNKYGYSIRYPFDWKITEKRSIPFSSSNSPIGDRILFTAPYKDQRGDVYVIGVNIIKYGRPITLIEAYRDSHKAGGSPDILSEKTIKFNDNSGTFTEIESLFTNEYIQLRDNTYFEIGNSKMVKDKNAEKKTYEIGPESYEIVSSFRFINKNSTDTSTWKTYIDSRYSFQLEYPNDWFSGDYSSCTDGLDADYLSVNKPSGMCNPEITILMTKAGDSNNCDYKSQSTLSEENIKTDEISGKKIIIKNPKTTGRNETIISFRKGNYCYTITNREQLVSEKIFDQILSTFKFTQ